MLRSVEFLQRALDALASTDNTEASLQLIGYLGKSLWLLTDHVVWMHKIKLFDVSSCDALLQHMLTFAFIWGYMLVKCLESLVA